MNKTIYLLLALPLFLGSCVAPGNTSSSDSLLDSSPENSDTVPSDSEESSLLESSEPLSTEEEGTSSSKEEEKTSSSLEETQSSSSSSSSVILDDLPLLEEDSRWNVGGALNSLRGADFRNALANSIKASGNKTCSYKSLWNYFVTSDASKNGTGIRPFYHSPDESVSKGSCNKEHVWPSSRGAGETGPGSDPQVIRPALSSENSSRGNKYFGDSSSREFDPGSLGYPGARGEAARILFYAATRYYDTCGTGGSSKGSAPLILNNNPGSDTMLHSLGTLKTLLKWNRQYPVNEAEIKRNESLADFGFARNPFIEHPEYADYIWDDLGLRSEASEEVGPTGTPHEMVTSLDDLSSGDKVYLVAVSGGLSYGATKVFSPNTPWYIKPTEGKAPVDGAFYSDDATLAKFSVTASGDGYVFTAEGDDLYSFIDGTHYSICYGKPASSSANPVSNSWNVSFSSSGAVTMKGIGTNVYAEFYNSSFCGYKAEGSIPLYLFKK